MATRKLKPLVVIVGPTASGKSHWALEIARKHNGEIIAADARTIYRGMNIGTAKPSAADQTEIPHHLIDVADPDTVFTAAQYKTLADAAIADVLKRKKLPILVGGTGLYVDAVLFDYQFRPPADPSFRKELDTLSVEELQKRVLGRGLALPHNAKNPRHLIRTLETGGVTPARDAMRANTLVIGIDADRKVLAGRLRTRTAAMIEAGLEEEVRSLAERFGWQGQAMSAIGYREWQPYFLEQVSIDDVVAKIVQNSLQYAKRQRTWFRRNKSIQWVDDPSKIVDIVTTFLNKTSV